MDARIQQDTSPPRYRPGGHSDSQQQLLLARRIERTKQSVASIMDNQVHSLRQRHVLYWHRSCSRQYTTDRIITPSSPARASASSNPISFLRKHMENRDRGRDAQTGHQLHKLSCESGHHASRDGCGATHAALMHQSQPQNRIQVDPCRNSLVMQTPSDVSALSDEAKITPDASEPSVQQRPRACGLSPLPAPILYMSPETCNGRRSTAQQGCPSHQLSRKRRKI